MSRTVDQLLESLDPLPHPARQQQLAKAVRSLAHTGDLPAVLAELDGRGLYERRLAALAALMGRQTDYLAERLADRDQVVRGYALRAARTLPVPDSAIEAAYEDASAVVRRQLTRMVTASHRTALAERLVITLRANWGDGEAVRLLPACSPEFVARLLPELGYAVNSWTPLGRCHPEVLLDLAERELAERPRQQRAMWWQQRADGVAAAAPAHPERVLGLLERYCSPQLIGPLHRLLGELITADAERAVRWMINPEHGEQTYLPLPTRSMLRRLVAADPPSLVALGRHYFGHPAHFAVLLRVLPPSRRAAFFEAASEGLNTDRFSELDLLPREFRWARARADVRRHTAAGADRHTVLTSLAHLPAAEAQPELLTAIRRPEAGDRARAWPLLVANAGRSGDPTVVLQVLDLAVKLRNEQDPVRSAALEALAQLPPVLFTAESTPLLDRILTDALEARDSSHRTRQALRRLAVALLRENAADGEPTLLAWALHALERITGYTGGADLGQLHRTLRRGQEDQVLEALSPWLAAAAKTRDYELLFSLTRSLGDRARRMPALQQLLWDAIKRGKNDALRTAAQLWLDEPSTRGARVAELLEREPSAVVLPCVQQVLTSRRTDLLDRLIAEQPPYGRFLKKGTRLPLPSFRDAHRWLPRQQEAAARLVAAAVADESQTLYARAAALRAAAFLPVHGRVLALRYADSPEVVLAEAALGALVWTEYPAEELPTLLAHVGGDRARVAVYAASRAARFASPSELAVMVGELLTATQGVKVTSRKEAVRLAAQYLPLGQAAEQLVAAYHAPGQHLDVQAAAVVFSATLLGSEQVWTLLADAAHGAPQSLHALLRTNPWELTEAHRPRYAHLVAQVCGAADREVADVGLQVLPRWAAYAPEALEVITRSITDLGNRTTWRSAARTLGTLATSGAAHPLGGADPGSLLHTAVTGLLAAVRAGEYEALADRDLPARQRLVELLSVRPDRRARPVLTAAAALLADEPSLTPTRIDLLRRTVDLDADPADLDAQLSALAAAHSGRPALASATAGRLRSDHTHGRLPLTPESVLAAAERLATEGGPAAGLLATALVAAIGPRLGWPEQWRTALRSLRRHPAADVRDAALAVTTEGE
ncbi:hypothetical protein [Kitasatospora sp. MAP5-34]|uniref:hypothetical protein n=1 Tax=Kitasatospora sp. MAP5-34 TaxID=3035102 RepID=UPI0024765C25|nr:hypothetical protein [Kitasatospora sp. MAP5-34]